MPAAVPVPTLVEKLVIANRILYDQGIVDGLGHASARHDNAPGVFLLSCNRAPGLVVRSDIAGHRLRPICHMAGFLGSGSAHFEIRETGGNTDMLIGSSRTWSRTGPASAACWAPTSWPRPRRMAARCRSRPTRRSPWRPTCTPRFPTTRRATSPTDSWARAACRGTLVKKIHDDVAQIIARPDFQARLAADALEPVAKSPEEFAAQISADLASWGKVIKAVGLKLGQCVRVPVARLHGDRPVAMSRQREVWRAGRVGT